MTTQPAEWAAGGALVLAAIICAVLTTRVLLRHIPGHRSALPGLMWLLATTALAVTGAALWATLGRSLGHTWPFAIALLIAVTPLTTAAIRRRRGHIPQNTADDGRRAP